jgi:hypothetical protein
MDRLLPRSLDNVYRGKTLALWLFGLVIAIRLVQSGMILFNPYGTVRSADGIPLDAYPASAAQTIVAMYALYALMRFLLSSIGVVTLVRYRSAIPLMFVVILVNYAAVQLLVQFVPLSRSGSSPASIVNRTLIAMTVVGLILSLWKRREA